jgi:hypothetical protein
MKRALQTNARSRRQVVRAERKTTDRARRADDLMREQLSTPLGRELIWNELERHGLYEDVTGGVETVYAFLGRRRVGLQLLAEVMRHPRAYLLMQQEAIARDQREALETEAAATQDESDEDSD